MIHNPYPTSENDDKSATRFQTYISAEDKALLMSLRPVKGTPQAIINNLILNVCRDLRDLNITSFRPDADDILAVLLERRPLTDDQLVRLRRTSIGVSEEIPTWLQYHRRRTEVRKRTSDAPTGSSHTKGETRRRVRRDSKTSTSGKADQS